MAGCDFHGQHFRKLEQVNLKKLDISKNIFEHSPVVISRLLMAQRNIRIANFEREQEEAAANLLRGQRHVRGQSLHFDSPTFKPFSLVARDCELTIDDLRTITKSEVEHPHASFSPVLVDKVLVLVVVPWQG